MSVNDFVFGLVCLLGVVCLKEVKVDVEKVCCWIFLCVGDGVVGFVVFVYVEYV